MYYISYGFLLVKIDVVSHFSKQTLQVQRYHENKKCTMKTKC